MKYLLLIGFCLLAWAHPAQSRHQDLTILTREQGLGLMREMITAVIMQHEAEMEAFGSRLTDMQGVMQRLTIQAVLDLGKACPASSKLLTQLGLSMAGVNNNLAPAQREAVRAVAQAMCTELAATEVAKPFAQRPAAERLALYWAASAKQLLAHRAALVAAFGAGVVTSKPAKDQLWQYIDVQMFEECPAYTGQLRVDLGLEKQANSRAALPLEAIAPDPV
ncbi:MAG: hypothetical protein EOO62_10220, partial [Hymenobacter sp.]